MEEFQKTRKDCINYAKCGVKSAFHCQKYRNSDPDCEGCTLIYGNRRFDSEGKEMKRCSRCGNYYHLNLFYDWTVRRGDKLYHCKASRCKMCISELNKRKNYRL
ncbi:hypothetical protein PO098_15100 [Bacteroides stercoris]|uniref:hypothetical protein n=1 Tax=Bacteroides stercoris TaxID=46506 RepID=UPI00233EE2EF|nr:hypothetical protein [Bacteroides stercoris]MDC2304295.1 hypothetical protein [Bacteroides stercoris]